MAENRYLSTEEIKEYKDLTKKADTTVLQIESAMYAYEPNKRVGNKVLDETWKRQVLTYIMDCCGSAGRYINTLQSNLRMPKVHREIVIADYTAIQQRVNYALKLANIMQEAVDSQDFSKLKEEHDKLEATKPAQPENSIGGYPNALILSLITPAIPRQPVPRQVNTETNYKKEDQYITEVIKQTEEDRPIL